MKTIIKHKKFIDTLLGIRLILFLSMLLLIRTSNINNIIQKCFIERYCLLLRNVKDTNRSLNCHLEEIKSRFSNKSDNSDTQRLICDYQNYMSEYDKINTPVYSKRKGNSNINFSICRSNIYYNIIRNKYKNVDPFTVAVSVILSQTAIKNEWNGIEKDLLFYTADSIVNLLNQIKNLKILKSINKNSEYKPETIVIDFIIKKIKSEQQIDKTQIDKIIECTYDSIINRTISGLQDWFINENIIVYTKYIPNDEIKFPQKVKDVVNEYLKLSQTLKYPPLLTIIYNKSNYENENIMNYFDAIFNKSTICLNDNTNINIYYYINALIGINRENCKEIYEKGFLHAFVNINSDNEAIDYYFDKEKDFILTALKGIINKLSIMNSITKNISDNIKSNIFKTKTGKSFYYNLISFNKNLNATGSGLEHLFQLIKEEKSNLKEQFEDPKPEFKKFTIITENQNINKEDESDRQSPISEKMEEDKSDSESPISEKMEEDESDSESPISEKMKEDESDRESPINENMKENECDRQSTISKEMEEDIMNNAAVSKYVKDKETNQQDLEYAIQDKTAIIDNSYISRIISNIVKVGVCLSAAYKWVLFG
ncbi:hypothetical protein TCON_0647 [Astathelohania contejeani]|uniref:Uncharacterized protein n=1 Tax=Astathelohania contejeani TaxID=164912 RepID=A0ABQ7I174_9MICR|nr:hypothetical protein TCON_0647 [Thelohania contejeani]